MCTNSVGFHIAATLRFVEPPLYLQTKSNVENPSRHDEAADDLATFQHSLLYFAHRRVITLYFP